MKSIVVTTSNDGGDLHILDVRATELHQLLAKQKNTTVSSMSLVQST